MKTYHVTSIFGGDSWAVQTLAKSVIPPGTKCYSIPEIAAIRDLEPCNIVWWHSLFYSEAKNYGMQMAPHRNYVIFYHDGFDVLACPHIHSAAVCNDKVYQDIKSSVIEGGFYRLRPGGAGDAIASYLSAPRVTSRDKLWIGIVGDARESMGSTRKGGPLYKHMLPHIDPEKFAFYFVGIGWGPWAADAQKIGIEAVSAGYFPDKEQYTQYKNMDIYLLPSREEGISMPLLETSGCGIWPVATPVGIAPELIEDGVNGTIITRHAGRAAANALNRLDRETIERSQVEVQARAKAWTWDRYRADYSEFTSDIETEWENR